jgi:hypothetical protein
MLNRLGQKTRLRVRQPEICRADHQRFCVLDGSVRVVVEAKDEHDARCLCQEMNWAFIGACDGWSD